MIKTTQKGIWFYGLSGVGKSYASMISMKYKKNSIIVDGDIVRQYISSDLGYSKRERNIQINRMFGIAKIIIESGHFPIVSSVWMNKKLSEVLKLNKINLIKVECDMENIFKNHITYKNKKNVVGKDIKYENFNSIKIKNEKDNKFWKELKRLI